VYLCRLVPPVGNRYNLDVKTGIVLCYGRYSPEKTSYKAYLDFVSAEIGKRALERVIICGGFTDPRESEAATVRDYLLSVKPEFNLYILEEKSITTNQNLEFAAAELGPDDEIVVYGDLIRMAKIIWIAMHFLLKVPKDQIYKALHEFVYAKDLHRESPGEFKYRNLTVVGFDFPGRTREETIRQTFATPLDVMALYDEDFARMDVAQRKKDLISWQTASP